jgi:hypothetical protein
MKKSIFTVVALIAALAMAAPALAYDLNLEGSLRSRGFFDSCNSLNSDYDNSSAWYNMRLRVRPTLTVSDNLKIHGRFDVLDDVRWGDYSSNRDTDWDRLWMSITTDYGKLEVGRMTGATWGTNFLDCAASADRIKYTIAFDELIMGAVYEKGGDSSKNGEVDSYYTSTDSDYDKYFLFGLYKSEMITGGLLIGWYNDKRGSDIYDTYLTYQGVTGACGTDIAAAPGNPLTPFGVTPYDREFWFFNPYGVVKVDDLTVQAEIFYHIGKFWEFDQAQYKDINKYPFGDNAGKKLKNWDYDAWAWNLEAQYDMGPFNFQAGYAWLQGQGETDYSKSDKINAIGTIGCDWEKLWILTGTEDDNLYVQGSGPECGLGGWGNLGDGPSATSLAQNGAKIFYVGAGFKPMENLNLEVLYGNAKAEAPLSDKWSKDYGSEYDFTLTWDIMDNLKYTFIAAYLDAGDFFKDSSSYTASLHGTAPISDLENTYSLFHELELSF